MFSNFFLHLLKRFGHLFFGKLSFFLFRKNDYCPFLWLICLNKSKVVKLVKDYNAEPQTKFLFFFMSWPRMLIQLFTNWSTDIAKLLHMMLATLHGFYTRGTLSNYVISRGGGQNFLKKMTFYHECQWVRKKATKWEFFGFWDHILFQVKFNLDSTYRKGGKFGSIKFIFKTLECKKVGENLFRRKFVWQKCVESHFAISVQDIRWISVKRR